MRALYHYRYMSGLGHDKALVGAQLSVEVLGLTDTQYKIKYLGFHANGAPVGHTTYVRKDRVDVDHELAARVLPRIMRPKKQKPKGDRLGWLPYKD